LKGVLHGGFSAPAQEQRYQQYLKSVTQALDSTIGVIQQLLLASTVPKGGHSVETCATVLQLMAHVWLHVHLRGARRALCNRGLVLGMVMALQCLRAALFNAWLEFSLEFVEVWSRSVWFPALIVIVVIQFVVNQVRYKGAWSTFQQAAHASCSPKCGSSVGGCVGVHGVASLAYPCPSTGIAGARELEHSANDAILSRCCYTLRCVCVVHVVVFTGASPSCP
jgi:hypothetical protein